jgi:hypothetical protein
VVTKSDRLKGRFFFLTKRPGNFSIGVQTLEFSRKRHSYESGNYWQSMRWMHANLVEHFGSQVELNGKCLSA